MAYQSQNGFRDRSEAGRLLAQRLEKHASRDHVVVLGLPRGGVPVAFEIARALRAPLDIVAVLKLCIARYPELALGAVAACGVLVLNEELVRRLGISSAAMAGAIAATQAELAARILSLRDHRRTLDVEGANVILVDDGLATGATMRAAVVAVREQNPAGILVAVPVAAQEAEDSIRRVVDDLITVLCPASFVSVGNWYQNFAQVTDDDVRTLLGAAHLNQTGPGEPRA